MGVHVDEFIATAEQWALVACLDKLISEIDEREESA